MARITIRNLRGLADTTVSMHESLTALVGENNAGKTTVLDAISAVLQFRKGRAPFDEGDFRLDGGRRDVRDAPPIEVTLELRPSTNEVVFAPGEPGRLRAQRDAAGEYLKLRLVCRYDPDPSERALVASLAEVRADESDVEGEFSSFPLADALRVSRFGAIRTVDQSMGARWSDWGRLKGDIRPPETTANEVLDELRALNERIVNETPVLHEVQSALGERLQRLGLSSGDGVRFALTPLEADELLRDLRVEVVSGGTRRHVEASRHGHGTQSALLFTIYRQLVERQHAEDGDRVLPVLLVEEPEAHLHPTAQRAFIQELKQMQGQVIMTTHSPDIVRGLGWENIVMMSVSDAGSRALSAKAPKRNPVRSLRLHANALFARAVLVVEGHGEADAVEWFARAMEIDLHATGIEVVNADSQNGIPGLRRSFLELGIPVVCIGDNDKQEIIQAFLKEVELSDTHVEARQAVLHEFDYFIPELGMNLERALHELSPAEFQAEVVPGWRGGQLTEAELIKKFKKDMAERIARRLTQEGSEPSRVPLYIGNAIRRAAWLARRSE